MSSLYEIIDPVPLDLAESVRQNFLQADFDHIFQERTHQFKKEFDEAKPNFPNNDEVYTSSFYRSKYLENLELIISCFHNHLKLKIESIINCNIKSVDLRCYKMQVGDHFRLHKDDYMSQFGFIWYLNKDWKWDWGGLLLTIDENNSASVTIPEFNKLIIMNHKYSALPHSVTSISNYAKEPRLTLVGFLQTT